MKYIIVHSHPENLVLSQETRERLFATGNVAAILESRLYSLQYETMKHWVDADRAREGLYADRYTIICCGTEDRYGIAAESGITILHTDRRSDLSSLVNGKILIPFEEPYTDDDGIEQVSRGHRWVMRPHPEAAV